MQNEERLLKVLINISAVDFSFSKDERESIEIILEKYPFNALQKQAILKEMNAPSGDFITHFKDIDSSYVRSKALDFARYLFHIDNQYTKEEKNAYLQLQEIQQRPYVVPVENDEEKLTANQEISFYEDIDDFGQKLSKKHFSKYWLQSYPFVIIYDLFRGGRYSFRLGLILIFLLFSYLFYRYVIV